eukprot:m.252607 g.252607  ORF g.252607 m.252607 type:complete len:62 (+) comp15916_c1_seq19:183-368(+)
MPSYKNENTGIEICYSVANGWAGTNTRVGRGKKPTAKGGTFTPRNFHERTFGLLSYRSAVL